MSILAEFSEKYDPNESLKVHLEAIVHTLLNDHFHVQDSA